METNDTTQLYKNPSSLPRQLCKILQNIPAIAVAYSGGVDSRFLLHSAKLCNCDVLAVHVTGPHISPNETNFAANWAKKYGIPYKQIYVDPLAQKEIKNNSPYRCYSCKKIILKAIKQSIYPDKYRIICDGGNADDYKQYRPGLKAVEEENILSPLAIAGLTKNNIRQYAQQTGMNFPNQRARPCLLTRYAYGLTPQRDTLAKLAQAEANLDQLFKENNIDFRLRLTPEPVLQIEKGHEQFLNEIELILKKFDFVPFKIISCQQVSGFFDKNDSSVYEQTSKQ